MLGDNGFKGVFPGRFQVLLVGQQSPPGLLQLTVLGAFYSLLSTECFGRFRVGCRRTFLFQLVGSSLMLSGFFQSDNT